MDDILTRHGFRVAVMKADAVAPNRREAWVADRVQEGIDVLICHPRLVQTGLDLIDFPTICLGRNGVLCLPINTKRYGSHGQSIWMQLRLNRWQQPAELQTSLLW